MLHYRFYVSQQWKCFPLPLQRAPIINHYPPCYRNYFIYTLACLRKKNFKSNVTPEACRDSTSAISKNSSSWRTDVPFSPVANPHRVRFLRKEIWLHLHLMKHGSLLEGAVASEFTSLVCRALSLLGRTFAEDSSLYAISFLNFDPRRVIFHFSRGRISASENSRFVEGGRI